MVYGVRVDYLSPTLYLFDCLVVATLFLQAICNPRTLKPPTHLIPILLVNLLFTANAPATLTWSLRFFLDLTLILSLGLVGLKNLLAPILIWLAGFEVTLALTQVILGHNLGGLFYYLGERSFSLGQPGIALTSIFNHLLLRGYGTFSHPNILAGWLIISLLIYLLLNPHRLGRHIYLAITILGVFVAGSRSAGLALFAFIIPLFYLAGRRLRLVYFFVVLTCVLSLGLLSPARSELSLHERLNLSGVSLQLIADRPIFGTGALAGVSLYPSVSLGFRLLQPDHFSPTLLLSWFGLFGVLALIPLLKSKIYHLEYFLPLFPLFLLDHYLLTSPQGIFIFVLYLRLALNYPHVQKNRQ